MREKILHLLNLKLKSRFQILTNMLLSHPDAFEYIPEPNQEEADAFFKGAAKHGARLINNPDELAKIILKFCTAENEQDVVKVILKNPVVLDTIATLNRSRAETLFVRTLYSKKRITEVDELQDPTETLLYYIKRPSYRMKFFSVKIEPISIALVPYDGKSKRLYEMALNLDPWVIKHIKPSNVDQRQKAINADYRTLKVISEQTEDDCLLALEKSTLALEYVLPKNRTYHMTKSVLSADHNLEWLNNGNFNSYHWSTDELKLMVEFGNKRLLGLLSLLIIPGTLEVSEETKIQIEEKLNLTLTLEEENL